MDSVERLGSVERLDHLVPKVAVESPDQLEHQDKEERLVQQDHQDNQDPQDLRDNAESVERPDPLDREVNLVPRDPPDNLDLRDLQANAVKVVPQEPAEKQDKGIYDSYDVIALSQHFYCNNDRIDKVLKNVFQKFPL